MLDRVSMLSRRTLLRRAVACSALFGSQLGSPLRSLVGPRVSHAADEKAEPLLERAADGTP
jgi:hypothetical protein